MSDDRRTLQDDTAAGILRRRTYGSRPSPDDLIPYEVWDESLTATLELMQIRRWRDLSTLAAVEDLLSVKGCGQKLVDALVLEARQIGIDIPARLQTRRFFGWQDRPIASKVGPAVYFFGCEAFIKIGIATDIRRRFTSLSLANPFPLELLALIPQPTKVEAWILERQLHRQFHTSHYRGEWFNADGPVDNYVATLRMQASERGSW